MPSSPLNVGDPVPDVAAETLGERLGVGGDADPGSGLRVSAHSDPVFVTRLDLPSCGGIEISSRAPGVVYAQTSASSMRSSAGVCTVRRVDRRASSPGVAHRAARRCPTRRPPPRALWRSCHAARPWRQQRCQPVPLLLAERGLRGELVLDVAGTGRRAAEPQFLDTVRVRAACAVLAAELRAGVRCWCPGSYGHVEPHSVKEWGP